MTIKDQLLNPSLDQMQQELRDLKRLAAEREFSEKKEVLEIMDACHCLIEQFRTQIASGAQDLEHSRNVLRQIKLGTRSVKRRVQRELKPRRNAFKARVEPSYAVQAA